MLKVTDSNGCHIGVFDGNVIRDETGKIIYWISENEVYAPIKYYDQELVHFNKGQFALIGKYVEGKCLIDGDVVFTVISK
tara:strand:+ start:437 stop:676 length:240 start_codon:yes stop_codon:yes gene_type:complete